MCTDATLPGLAVGKAPRRRYTDVMNPIRLFALAAFAGCLALPAAAQWQWVDQDGRKIFSDRPPPADIPEKSILKRPGQRGSGSVTPSTPAPDTAPVPSAAPAGGVDKALQDKKKQADEAQAAQRKAEEERNARIRADNCARAQQAKMGVDSGARMARTNEKGEREFFDEATLAAESARLQAIINENCR